MASHTLMLDAPDLAANGTKSSQLIVETAGEFLEMLAATPAAARPPAIAPALRECLDWFEQTLIDKGYMKAPSEYPEKNNLPHC